MTKLEELKAAWDAAEAARAISDAARDAARDAAYAYYYAYAACDAELKKQEEK